MSSKLHLVRQPCSTSSHGSPIKDAERLARSTPGALSLAQGNAPFEPPPEIVEAVCLSLGSTETWRYTPCEGRLNLRQAIAADVAREGTAYDPETEVIVTVGATEALAATLLTVLGPDDEALVPTPAYVSFRAAVGLARARVVSVPMSRRGLTGFQFDLDAMRRAITPRTRCIVLANPSNPTGCVLSRSELEGLASLAEQHDLNVIIDEVYRSSVFEHELCSPGSVADAKERFVRVYGFGKTYGMCGLRIGYVLAPRSLARRILATHDAMANSAPHIAQVAALTALERCHATRAGFARRLRPLRELALAGLELLSDLFVVEPPPATYFLFPRLKPTGPFGLDDEACVRGLFESTRVVLVPGSAFGPGGEGHVRLSFAADTETLSMAFDRLVEAVVDERAV